jgi:hypothetical protein
MFDKDALTQTYQEKVSPDGKLLQAVVVDNKAYVLLAGKAIWQSDPDYKMENVLVGDFNNDGQDEIGFSLWKKGSYGPNLPFWEKENDQEISNHLFLYQLFDGATGQSYLRMVWGSSALDQPIIEMALVDLDKDGKNELAVLEEANSEGAIRELDLRNLAIWRFDDFNFVNLYKSQKGNFFDIQTDLNYIYIREQ